MTKIAIYGDSFAAGYEGWPKYLGELMKCEVKTFGFHSTSVAYSYLKFLETHEDYDLVYFIWTDFSRNWLVSTPDKITLQHQVSFIPTHRVPESVRSETKKTTDIDIVAMSDQNMFILNQNPVSKDIKLLSDWILDENKWSKIYLNKNLLSVIAMQDSVNFKRPDCVNIQSFENYKVHKNKITPKITPGMWRIELQDMMQYSKEWVNEKPGKRINHLTETQNKEFAQYLYKLHQSKDFDIHKTFENPKKYYTMSKTLEESGFAL